MELKNGVTYQVWTGYKIWYSEIEVDTEAEKDADSFEFLFNDLSGCNALAFSVGIVGAIVGMVF